MHASFSKFFSLFPALVMTALVALIGCSDDQSKKADAKAEHELVLGTSADMPPFEFYKDSEIVGYDIDIAKAVAKELGKTLSVRDMDFNALIPALQSGRVEMAMASMTPTPEREKAIDFSAPYLTLPLATLTFHGDVIHSPAHFKGKKIGVQLGSTHEQYARDLASKDPSIDVHPLNKLSELVQELVSKRIDVVVMETKTAKSFQELNHDIKVTPLDNADVSFAIAFPKGSKLRDQVNVAIQKLQQDGTLDKIRATWFTDFQK